jgi:hypothetical protein
MLISNRASRLRHRKAHSIVRSNRVISRAAAARRARIDWSINEIKQSVRPTTAQRDAFDDVRRSFDDAARDLETHCPTTIPASALSRLDTIQARLDSTWRATLSIQVALANFVTELNDAQKIRFDAMNFAARVSPQPVQRDAGSGRLNAR